jgi:two-component system, chemotaxis family, chemotaxis protein CheY
LARKILLADDSVTAQNMGRKILADAGYEVITVNNGSAALKKIAETKPDLIVLDVYMPGYSGLEVCQRLKETGDTSRIPILLTVGKLEPFKPEEAKRARADGFIIKPFEASELLSVLTKLEDKIVPNGESSKPGRFARAIAAVEEGRYDKASGGDPAKGEEDGGWKNRIAFPSKKKAKEEPAESDESAIYNPVNKDLRTTVDRSAAAKQAEPEQRVDLGAVAPEGLPKDVTPEEIAALAAAAAQIQGKSADAKGSEAAQEVAETKAETKNEIKTDIAREATVEMPVVKADDPASAPVAEQKESKQEEKTRTDAPAESEVVRQVPDLAAVTPADVMAAINGLEASGFSSAPVESASHTSSDTSARAEAEPITMAVAAGAEHAFVQTRWSAVPVAVAPEEAAIILEEEMRKAYAAGAEAAASSPIETQSAAAHTTPTEPDPSAVDAAPSSSERAEDVQTSSGEVSTTEALRAAVRDFEAVSAASSPAAEMHSTDAEVASASSTIPSSPEFQKTAEAKSEVEAKAEEAPVARISEPAAEAVAPSIPQDQPSVAETSQPEERRKSDAANLAEAKVEEPKIEELKADELKIEAPKNEAFASGAPAASPMGEAEAPSATRSEEASFVRDIPVADAGHAAEEFQHHATAVASEPANQDSDIAATTAAAWASWRRVRETGDSTSAGPSKENGGDQTSALREAAMAVAAGAEKAPEEGEAPEIANIVDSVLADLRPRIVEEISKKLKKKS